MIGFGLLFGLHSKSETFSNQIQPRQTTVATTSFPVHLQMRLAAPLDSAKNTKKDREPVRQIELQEVVVEGNNHRDTPTQSPQSILKISKEYIETYFSGSLMQSLEKIAGVQAMTIGSGQSKPAIRGFGFNRMVIVEDGVKHEGQQWGEDHGLEIDQFSIDDVEIIKGPGSLFYGPDAIGGVISLHHNRLPSKKLEGDIKLYGRSNNQSAGMAGRFAGRFNRWYCRIDVNYTDYADYKVPTDSIQYYSYWIRLKEGRLRNTAGREQNVAATAGWLGKKFNNQLRISNIRSQNGFFADARGLEVRLSDINYDRSDRDIDLPRHSVDHFKVINHSVWRTGRLAWEGNLAYQKNSREELTEPVSHGYMPKPTDSLERKFDKETFTVNTAMKMPILNRATLQIGFSAEQQKNRRGGWGFVIPDFRNTHHGAFFYGRYYLSGNTILSAGIRGDRVSVAIDRYRDWYPTPDDEGNPVFRERATDLRKAFKSITWSAGLNHQSKKWDLKTHIGKSFRAPTPKELGSDGINYHLFRYEQGNRTLDAEESYQADVSVAWRGNALTILWEPFLNYFPNYIYLNPTAEYYEGLQKYYYAQAVVIRHGFEAGLQWKLNRHLSLDLQSEYLYAKQLSGSKKGYTLPFSPPWSANAGFTFRPDNEWSGKNGEITLEYRVTGAQKRIVPPEEKTDGYRLVNLSAGRSWDLTSSGKANGNSLRLHLKVENLLDKRYYNHTGFYRLIDVPEPGRNFSLLLNYSF